VKSSSRFTVIIVAALLLLATPPLVTYYTDWLWFIAVGYRAVFVRQLVAQTALGLAVGLGAFALLAINLRVTLALLAQPYLVFGTLQDGRPLVLDRRQLRRLALLAAALVALVLGLSASTSWLQVLEYLHQTSFGQRDPIFGRDVAFYVFTLPVLDLARGLLLIVVVLSLLSSAGIYIVSGGVSFDPRTGLGALPRARLHLSLLVACLFLLMAAGSYLDMPRLLLSPSGIIQGASYVDVYARLPFLRLGVVVLVVGAALAAYHGFVTRGWPIIAAVGLTLVVWVAGGVYATAIQRFVVAPNEQEKEIPFIVHNIDATRRAFALDHVEERELTGDAALTRADIQANGATLDNVRLWDHQPLLDTFGQIQEIRTYYDFVSVDNDRYVIDGKYRQIMLSARELNSDSLPNRTWVNERLTFTHGYGLTLGPVNQVTSEGLPVLFIKDLPPVSSVDLPVTEPSIYFGELSSDYVLVKTLAKEFHYPKGDDNVYSVYTGSGGVSIGTFWRRLAFGLRFRSSDILLTEQVTPESRILFHRRLQDRIRTIAPFLAYDSDPYLVISDGRLFWLQDAYTTTTQYPYSTPAAPSGVDYIRNSVKVVVDAYNGTTRFYLADPADPIADTLGKVFPGLLKPFDEMPEGIRQHVRYPEDIFTIQTAMYSTYHMTNPAVFYNKEDQWEVPSIDTDSRPSMMRPYYTIMSLPGEESAEFIQMLPFTPRRKDNLAAWMVARSDVAHYGQLAVFQFPKQKVVFGPRQIVARINQDQIISPQITLWNQQGSQVIYGTLLVIPIEESLIYVRPLYLKASGGRIPELKRVIVAYQNTIVMEETLQAALDKIFGPGAAPAAAEPEVAQAAGAAPPPPAPRTSAESTLATLADQARDHYQRALEAQRSGDWALYGEEIKKLGEVLEQMAKGRQ
jgi:uncharacterized membrane protein (UPF0182 family)